MGIFLSLKYDIFWAIRNLCFKVYHNKIFLETTLHGENKIFQLVFFFNLNESESESESLVISVKNGCRFVMGRSRCSLWHKLSVGISKSLRNKIVSELVIAKFVFLIIVALSSVLLLTKMKMCDSLHWQHLFFLT